jgi:hypothetical protein
VVRTRLTLHISWDDDSQGCIHLRIEKDSYSVPSVSPVLSVCFALIEYNAKPSDVQLQCTTPKFLVV